MPAVAHIGLGLGAKKMVPDMNVGYLILASEATEVLFMILWSLGVEHPPTEDVSGYANYSHSIIGGVLLSVFAGILTWFISKKRKHAVVIGFLVLSHMVMDVVASPMTAFYKNDLPKTVFFNDSWRFGLGLWRHKTLALILEYGILAIGAMIYLMTKIKGQE